jgi:hypothetical protein
LIQNTKCKAGACGRKVYRTEEVSRLVTHTYGF